MKPYNPLNFSFWLTAGAVTGSLLLPIFYIIGYAIGFVGFFIFLAVAGETGSLYVGLIAILSPFLIVSILSMVIKKIIPGPDDFTLEAIMVNSYILLLGLRWWYNYSFLEALIFFGLIPYGSWFLITKFLKNNKKLVKSLDKARKNKKINHNKIKSKIK